MAKAALVSTDFVSAPEIGENGHYTYGFIGKHGDSVPTEGMTTGSWFLETDTGVMNFFDGASGQWEPMGGGEY